MTVIGGPPGYSGRLAVVVGAAVVSGAAEPSGAAAGSSGSFAHPTHNATATAALIRLLAKSPRGMIRYAMNPPFQYVRALHRIQRGNASHRVFAGPHIARFGQSRARWTDAAGTFTVTFHG
jgi:hypothetical protein